MKNYTTAQLLVREVELVYREFMWMPNEHAYTVAPLWVMHTHLRDAGSRFLPYVTPRLYFGSKSAGCGKTLALELTARMSHNGEMILEPTPPSVTTMMNGDHATLGFDEIDLYFGRGTAKGSMRAILNGGYKRGAYVTRERSGQAERLNCHGPIVMAGKNAVRFLTSEHFETLRTRSISIILERKPHDTYVGSYRPEIHDERLRGLMKRLRVWGLKYGPGVVGIDVERLIPERIANRDEEIWTILFRVAAHLGDEWPARCEATARAFVLGEWENDDAPMLSPNEELLYAVRAVFGDEEQFVPTNEVLRRLDELPQRMALMREWHSERAATMGLSRALSLYGIEPVRRTHCGEQVRGYDRDDLGCQPANLDNQPTSCTV